MTEQQKKVMESAALYAKGNLAVFPVDAEKHPCTPHGFKDASDDQERVRKMFEQYSDFQGVALATGPIFVIDLDRNHGDGNVDGVETARTWQMQHGSFPQTWTATTGSGGQHLFFLGSGDETCTTNEEHGIDRKAAGGYVVLPPSKLKNGQYFWDISPTETKLAVPNKSLLDFMDVYCKPTDKKQHFQVPETIPEGCRNRTLFSAAASLQAAGWPDSCIDAAVEELNNISCVPPLDDKEIGVLLESVKKYEKGGRLEGWQMDAKFQEKEILEKLRRKVKSLT